MWGSHSYKVNTERNPDRKKNTIDDESVKVFSTNNNKGDGDREATEGDGEKALKKWRTDAYEAIQALQKRPNIDSQTIYKSAASIPSCKLIPIPEKHGDELTPSRWWESQWKVCDGQQQNNVSA